MNTVKKSFRSLRRAFTLIELLVVIAIIVVLVAIAIPSLKILGQSNSQKQAVNLVTSLIALARANAIQSHTQAGLVIYEDPATKNGSSAQLIIASAYGAGITDFIRAPRTVAQHFPLGITLATLDNTANLFKTKTTDNTTNTIEARVILFDENGQLILHNGLTTDPSLSTDAAAFAWDLNGASVGVSSPALIVYDATELQAAKDSGKVTTAAGDPSLGAWIEQHADIIVINPYTGNVIR